MDRFDFLFFFNGLRLLISFVLIKVFLGLFAYLLDKLVSFAKLHVSDMISVFNVMVVVFEWLSAYLTKETLRFWRIHFLRYHLTYLNVHIAILFLNFTFEFLFGLFMILLLCHIFCRNTFFTCL